MRSIVDNTTFVPPPGVQPIDWARVRAQLGRWLRRWGRREHGR